MNVSNLPDKEFKVMIIEELINLEHQEEIKTILNQN